MKISLCMIVKNEEKNLEKCIMSSKHLVDEIVVVDTGSIDNTINLAEEMGANIYHFDWVNDFAQARNYAIEKCSGDWILFLDADEYLGEVIKKEIVKKLRFAEKNYIDALVHELINIEESTGDFQSIIKTIRLFKRCKSIRYKGSIHEALSHETRELRIIDISDCMKVFHTGYSVETVKSKAKGERNLELLFKELDENPTSSDICFYIVECLLLKGDIEEALQYTYKVEEYSNGTISGIYQKNILHRLKILIGLDKEQELILEEYKKALQIEETYPDYEYAMAEYYINNNSIDKAIEHIEKCIDKMNNYCSIVESWIVPKAQGVFITLSNLYILKKDKVKAVKLLTSILNVDRYNYDSLFKLVNLLDESESSLDIFNFLTKLYDMQQLKDKLYLLKATKNMKKQFVYNMLYELLSDEEKVCMNNR